MLEADRDRAKNVTYNYRVSFDAGIGDFPKNKENRR